MNPWLRAACMFSSVLHFGCAVALAWEAGEIHGAHEFASIMVGSIAVLSLATGFGYGLVTHLLKRDIM